jgi:Resolvase, N terminal domain
MTDAAVWLRVSAGHQDSDNQVPDVQQFAQHHGHEVAKTYTVSDSAWKDGGGPEYRRALKQAMDDAYAGKFSVLIVWSLDRATPCRLTTGKDGARLRILAWSCSWYLPIRCVPDGRTSTSRRRLRLPATPASPWRSSIMTR